MKPNYDRKRKSKRSIWFTKYHALYQINFFTHQKKKKKKKSTKTYFW